MENNSQKDQALADYIKITTEANELTRSRVSAHDLFLRAIFDALSPEQKETVLESLNIKTSNLSAPSATVTEDMRFELFRLLPELLRRSKLN
ncbi:hypothetical protein ISX58_17795 [Citrobacter amalonaticus]|uniref:hypothetical protein n=1 Tax=Citrobacter amalonaticus TaxID=35703 RepID=UPI00188DC26E|nr:hypothetical protein [Citrobacter amalonaticus]QPB31319.1 hypothetical protein ISX58_17795 [Citrobacter amalonaticus]